MSRHETWSDELPRLGGGARLVQDPPVASLQLAVEATEVPISPRRSWQEGRFGHEHRAIWRLLPTCRGELNVIADGKLTPVARTGVTGDEASALGQITYSGHYGWSRLVAVST